MKASVQVACPICQTPFTQYQGAKRGPYPRTCSRACGRALEWRSGQRDQQKRERTSHTSGYVMLRRPDHPRAYKHGWVFEHIVVMEEKLGRPIGGRERVHHKNGIRSDNRPDNLELWTLDHKDPAGVRAMDAAIAAMERLTPDQRAIVFDHFDMKL